MDNWLFARQSGGEFLLRIEDTDAERNRPELIDNVLEMLEWLGLKWDGTPIKQSDRGELYADAAAKLVASGAVDACECTVEKVEALNKEAGGKPGYYVHCNDKWLEPGPCRALRFRTPGYGSTCWMILICDEILVDNC